VSPDAEGMDSEEERAFNGERDKGMSVTARRAGVVRILDAEQRGRRAAALAAIGALLLALLTTAPRAGAATIYVCQKGGTIHVVAKKATCRRDETKLWWGTGAANGVTGATGATGTAGQAGANGAAGVTGATGPAGVTGATGATGEKGEAASKGVAGATGPQGKEGKTGGTGATGPEGKEGAASGLVHWRKTVETPGPAESEAKSVVLATAGPFTLTGKCWQSESSTEAATYIRTSEDGSHVTSFSEHVALNATDGDTLIWERVRGSTATHEATFGALNNKVWAAESHDGSVALTGFANQGVWLQGKTGPACSFSGYFVSE
jgi:hypothetical protein